MPNPNDQQQAPVTSGGDTPEGNYADFAEVFDSLTDKEGNDEGTTTGDTPDGAAGAEGDAGQQVQQADGGGDSGQPPASGENPLADDGQGAQDGQGGDAAGGQQGGQNVDWEARFRELEARIAPPQAPAAPQPQAPAEPQSIYTADEQAELKTLQEDWPDLHKMFSLMARQLQVDTLNYAFNEVGKVIAPLQESVQTFSVNDHMAAIYEAHEDYDQVYQPAMEWVDKQPNFLKTAYQNVIKQGTAEDVAQMLQRFKDETGWKSPAAGGNTASQPRAAAAGTPPAQTTGLSDAAKKAAKAMGAVGTKRGAQAGAQDPADFDGAWDEATAA